MKDVLAGWERHDLEVEWKKDLEGKEDKEDIKEMDRKVTGLRRRDAVVSRAFFGLKKQSRT